MDLGGPGGLLFGFRHRGHEDVRAFVSKISAVTLVALDWHRGV